MQPEEILNELTKVLSQTMAETAGLSVGKSEILSKAIKSIVDYVSYKRDPLGKRQLAYELNKIAMESQRELIKNALTVYRDKINDELKCKEDISDVLLEAQRYFNNPSFKAFFSYLQDPFDHKKRKKRNKSKYYSNKAWWYRFCEYLDRRYEDWRHELLGKALYLEQVDEGAISYTTLWQIIHLPPHSWEDLTQFKSLCGEIWVNDEFCYNFLPGTYSVLSAMEYKTDIGKRLVSDLIESLDEDNLQQDTGVIVLSEDDENVFKFLNSEYLIEKDPSYEDPQFEDVSDTPLEGKIRLFGTKPTYIGQEILDLASDIKPNAKALTVFKHGLNTVEEDGINFVLR